MHQEEIVIRQSPFIFIKYIVIVEFFFALIPLLAIQLLGAQASYETAALAQTVSYGWLITIIVTTLQVLILTLAFVAWYFPTYYIDRKEIVYRRGGLYQDTMLIEMKDMDSIIVQQRWLGKRLNYGNLLINSGAEQHLAAIKNVPGPNEYRRKIDEIVRELGNGDGSSYKRPIRDTETLTDLIRGGENQYTEFKASLIWDYHREIANKELYTPVMKNIVAFLNSGGGDVLIGVGDEGEILGLDPDFGAIQKKNTDGFENIFNMAFNKMIGVEFRQFVTLTFPVLDDKIICRCAVAPGSEPAYLQYKGDERFYIRAGNASQPLPVSKATHYVQSHFDR
jgi:hypothetical protein